MSEEASHRITQCPAALAESKARGKRINAQTSICTCTHIVLIHRAGEGKREGLWRALCFEATPTMDFMAVVLKLCIVHDGAPQ